MFVPKWNLICVHNQRIGLFPSRQLYFFRSVPCLLRKSWGIVNHAVRVALLLCRRNNSPSLMFFHLFRLSSCPKVWCLSHQQVNTSVRLLNVPLVAVNERVFRHSTLVQLKLSLKSGRLSFISQARLITATTSFFNEGLAKGHWIQHGIRITSSRQTPSSSLSK